MGYGVEGSAREGRLLVRPSQRGEHKASNVYGVEAARELPRPGTAPL